MPSSHSLLSLWSPVHRSIMIRSSFPLIVGLFICLFRNVFVSAIWPAPPTTLMHQNYIPPPPLPSPVLTLHVSVSISTPSNLNVLWNVPSGTKKNYEMKLYFVFLNYLYYIHIYLIYIMQELPTNKWFIVYIQTYVYTYVHMYFMWWLVLLVRSFSVVCLFCPLSPNTLPPSLRAIYICDHMFLELTQFYVCTTYICEVCTESVSSKELLPPPAFMTEFVFAAFTAW